MKDKDFCEILKKSISDLELRIYELNQSKKMEAIAFASLKRTINMSDECGNRDAALNDAKVKVADYYIRLDIIGRPSGSTND